MMKQNMQLSISQFKTFFDQTLQEDLAGGGDITTHSIIRTNRSVDFQIKSREDAIICGLVVSDYFWRYHSNISYNNNVSDGDFVYSGDVILSGSGDIADILKLERVVLNYLQHLSGVATLTHQYVQKTSSSVRICDTRKTIPGIRSLQKYAVRCGGGFNHRYGLDSSILIKDNHIAICGSIALAVSNARNFGPHFSKIELECDNLEQVEEGLKAEVDIIMLDNMDIKTIQKAISLIGSSAKINVSGGVNLDNIEEIGKLNIDYISIGRLTHSANAIDIGLDIAPVLD